MKNENVREEAENNGGALSRRSTGPFQCCHLYSSVHDFLEEVMLLYLLGDLSLASCSHFRAVLLFVCVCLVYGSRCSLCTPSRGHLLLGCRLPFSLPCASTAFTVFSVLSVHAVTHWVCRVQSVLSSGLFYSFAPRS